MRCAEYYSYPIRARCKYLAVSGLFKVKVVYTLYDRRLRGPVLKGTMCHGQDKKMLCTKPDSTIYLPVSSENKRFGLVKIYNLIKKQKGAREPCLMIRKKKFDEFDEYPQKKSSKAEALRSNWNFNGEKQIRS